VPDPSRHRRTRVGESSQARDRRLLRPGRWRGTRHRQPNHRQSELRNAFTAEKTYFTDNLAWTADPETLRLIEPTLEYQPGERPAVEGLVYVVVEEHLLGLAGKSASGDCFYLMSDSTTFTARHAVDSACRRMQQQDYQPNWP
jgi:hypothetical protein